MCDHVLFKKGYSHETDLGTNSADIITCASAFQWMEPKSTMAEVIRILKVGGVFAIYNHDGIPAIDYIIEKTYKHMFFRFYIVLDEIREKEKPWTLASYLKTIEESGEFDFTKEIVLHSKAMMTAEDIIGFTFS